MTEIFQYINSWLELLRQFDIFDWIRSFESELDWQIA